MENTIHCGDCLELMPKIKDRSIDLILCDLPYGTTQNKWDSVISMTLLWEQYERIIKDNGAIILFAQSPFDKVLGCSNLKLLRYEWIWEKPSATGFLNAKICPMKAHENILVFYKKAPTYNPIMTTGARKVSKMASKDKDISSSNYGKQYYRSDYDSTDRYPRSVLKFSTDKQKGQLHPTQKPLELIKYLINTYTNKGDLVLDNCMGSGTTICGAIQLERKYIGIEITKEYFEVAQNRINRFLGDVGLFDTKELICL